MEWVGIALSAVGLLFSLAAWLRRRYKSTLGLKKESVKLLSKLAANVPIDHFMNVLGQPRNVRTHGRVREYSFVHRYFHVQAISDDAGAVLRYAVTSKDSGFNPPIWPSEYHPKAVPRIIRRPLGTFVLAEPLFDSEGGPSVTPDGVHGTLGAQRWEWVEAYYIGGPGGYRYFFVGLNDAGWLQEPFPPLADALEDYGANVGIFGDSGDTDEVEEFITRPNVHAYRTSSKPNTYGATAPYEWVDPEDFPGWFGVDGYQIPRLPGD